MNFSIVGIGVVLSIIFAAMKAAAVPSMATWSWFGARLMTAATFITAMCMYCCAFVLCYLIGSILSLTRCAARVPISVLPDRLR